MAAGNVVIGKSVYAHSCGAEKGGGGAYSNGTQKMWKPWKLLEYSPPFVFSQYRMFFQDNSAVKKLLAW